MSKTVKLNIVFEYDPLDDLTYKKTRLREVLELAYEHELEHLKAEDDVWKRKLRDRKLWNTSADMNTNTSKR